MESQKTMITKTCPICKIEKSVDGFNKYYSKERQKYRCQNYCKACEKVEKTRRSAEYFQKHKEKRLQYAKDYRADPNNADKLKTVSKKFKVKYREVLKGCYVRDQLVQRAGFSNAELHKHPEIVTAKRTQLLINRKIKQHGTEQNRRS
jgi:hypothetical protein